MALSNPYHRYNVVTVAGVFLLFAVAAFLITTIYDFPAGHTGTYTLPPQGGEVPLAVDKAGQVYSISLRQPLVRYNTWSVLSGTLLDENHQFLMHFNKELWKETGRDSDGTWREESTTYTMNLTMPRAGMHYLTFDTDMSSPDAGRNISVKIQPRLGSSLATFIFGFVCLVLGGVLMFVAVGEFEEE